MQGQKEKNAKAQFQIQTLNMPLMEALYRLLANIYNIFRVRFLCKTLFRLFPVQNHSNIINHMPYSHKTFWQQLLPALQRLTKSSSVHSTFTVHVCCLKIEAIYHKNALRETQTLRAGCSKAQPRIFAPPQTPSRGRRTAKI